MNKLKFFTGGDPLYIEDIEFSQDAVAEAIKGIMSGVANDAEASFILSGCTATYDGTTYTVAAGYVCIKGEVFKVDSHTTAVLSHWGELVSYDADGDQVFEDTVEHSTHEVRKAKVYPSDPGSGVAYASVERISAKLLSLLAGVNGWLTTFSYESPFVNYGAPYDNVAYRYDQMTGKVVFKGHLKRSPGMSHTADVKVFTISVPAYRPANQQEVALASVGDNFTNKVPVVLIVKTDGTVWLKADASVSIDSGNISLDGASYAL